MDTITTWLSAGTNLTAVALTLAIARHWGPVLARVIENLLGPPSQEIGQRWAGRIRRRARRRSLARRDGRAESIRGHP